MKNRYNKKPKSSYEILLTIIFAVLVWLFFDFFEVYKALHFFNKFVYIEPTFISIVLSHIVIMMDGILVVFLYDKVKKRNKAIKQGSKKKKRKKKVIKKENEKNFSKSDKNKIAFCVIATLLISIFCFFSYYYISDDSLTQNKRNIISNEQVFDAEDVNQINIEVDTILHHSRGGRGYIYREYIVQCTIICQKNEYILNSGGFKGYDAMYRYIAEFKDVKICTNKENFDQLCTYEKEKIWTTKEKSTNNIMYLEKIFALGGNDGALSK